MAHTATPLRALIVEDQEDDALLLLNALKRGGYVVRHERVDTQGDLQRALDENWDIVFSDHSMPYMTGIEALDVVRSNDADIPFIFVSGTIGEDVAVEAMRKGAHDYIMKDNLKRLLPAVERELKEAKIRKARRAAEKRLLYLARFDALTGLPNRLNFIYQLRDALENASLNQRAITVIYIDLDRFKSVNDSLGYEAGDMLLKETAQRLSNVINNQGVVARFGADEFAMLVYGHAGAGDTVRFVNKLFRALEQTYTIYGWSMYVSASIGVSIYPEDSDNAEALLRNADIAAYRTKQDGGRGYLFYTSAMAVQLEQRLALERHLRLGIEKNEFTVHYQPQVELSTGRIVGLEALLRWNNPETGLISPADFIPLSEQTGFILPLGRWVLRQVCAQIQSWRAAGLRHIRVAVNVSARQFLEDEIAPLLAQMLKEYDLPASALEIEITETTIMRDTARAIKILNAIRALGIKVALDDFGTGYSSLSYLKSFKTDYLKIDQSFIRGLPNDKDDREIVSAIIAMAEKLSIQSVAEGVETEAQYEFLKAQGCGRVQGFYCGKPQPAASLAALLKP